MPTHRPKARQHSHTPVPPRQTHTQTHVCASKRTHPAALGCDGRQHVLAGTAARHHTMHVACHHAPGHRGQQAGGRHAREGVHLQARDATAAKAAHAAAAAYTARHLQAARGEGRGGGSVCAKGRGEQAAFGQGRGGAPRGAGSHGQRLIAGVQHQKGLCTARTALHMPHCADRAAHRQALGHLLSGAALHTVRRWGTSCHCQRPRQHSAAAPLPGASRGRGGLLLHGLARRRLPMPHPRHITVSKGLTRGLTRGTSR